MTTPDEERLEQQAKAAFDDSVERLDAATLSKLNQSRQAALAEVSRGHRSRQWVWMPATGVAAAALVAVVVLRGPAAVDVPPEFDSSETDFEILMGDDEFELIEDLEFYSWMDAADLDNAG